MEKTSVLIVDDSAVMCQFLTLFLEKKFEVSSFTNSQQALKSLYMGFRPGLIVTDLNMPELDGISFINAVRPLMPDVPILVVSGLNGSKERIRSFEAGADDFLSKPYHPAELDVRLKKLLSRKVQPVIQSSPLKWSKSILNALRLN